MPQGTLRQQRIATATASQQGRITRTDRVLAQQQYEREKQAQINAQKEALRQAEEQLFTEVGFNDAQKIKYRSLTTNEEKQNYTNQIATQIAQTKYDNELIPFYDNNYFRRADITRAYELVNRKLAGKSAVTYGESGDVRKIFDLIFANDSSLRKQLDRVTGLKIASREAGFGNNVEKYLTTKKWLGIGFSEQEYKTIDPEGYAIALEKSRADAYAEWEKTNAEKPFYLDVKSIDTSKFGYNTRGTIGGSTTGFMPINPPTITTPNVSIFSKIGSTYSNIVSKTPDIKIPIFSFGGMAGGSIKLKEILTPTSEFLGTKSQEVYDKMVGATPNKLTIDTTFQEEYQTRYEREYMKKLIFGETDFETSSKEFAKSDTAKVISEKYGMAITEDTKNMKLLQKWGYGSELVGLGLAKMVVDFTPTNYGDLAVKGALVYSGYKVITTIPPSVNLLLTGGFFAKGTYDAFDPTSTPIQAGGGLITAGISGASLGYAGYRWLGSPVVKTRPVKLSKSDLTSAGSIGKDLKIVSNTKELNKVLYGEQKLSQVVQAGRKTVVTTKWRSLLNKYAGTNLEAIYKGIPTQQQAIYGSNVFRGGRYKITASGYEKAMNKLLNYGYTKSQATSTLRYYAPKVTEQWLKKGYLNIEGDVSSSGMFAYQTKKPVIEFGRLGLKTRGGKTITDFYKVDRKIVNINDQQLMAEIRQKISFVGTDKIKEWGFSKSLTKAQVTDLKVGSEFLRRDLGLNIYRTPTNYRDIYSLSKDTFSFTVTPKRTKTIIEIMNNQRAVNLRKATLFDWELDLTKIPKEKAYFTFSKTGSAWGDTGTSNVDKVIKQITGQSSVFKTPKVTPITTPTGITDQKIIQLSQLKTDVAVDPILKSKIGAITGVKLNTFSMLDTGLLSATAVQLKSQQKMSVGLKAELKEMSALKVDQSLRTDLKQAQSLKSASLQVQTPKIDFNILSPRYSPPSYPKFPKTPFPIIAIFGGEQLKQKIKAKAKRKTPETFALLPDFTARAIGLKPQEFGSVKDAMKEIKKLQTGFGIRRGGRIKGYKPVDEKSLMMGIMK